MEYFASCLTLTNRLELSNNPALLSHITVITSNQADTQQLLRQIQGLHNCKRSAAVLFDVLRAPLKRDVARLIATILLETKYDERWF